MLSGRLTQIALRGLDRVIGKTPSTDDQTPSHQRTGRRGEEDAYFYLRRRGSSWWHGISAQRGIMGRLT